MFSGKQFRLVKPTLAIEEAEGRRVAITIPEGETLRVISGPTPSDPRLVDVEWSGRRVVMFAVDLHLSAESAAST